MKSQLLKNSLIVIILATCCGSASAATIAYGLTVKATEGPLQGTIAAGVLAYDTDIIPSGGGFVTLDNPLLAFDLTWNSIEYDDSLIDYAAMLFDNQGDLVQFVFGTDCGPVSCSVTPGVDGFSAAFTGSINGSFFYGMPGETETFEADLAFSGPVTIPVPGAAILLVSAMLSFFRFSSRPSVS